MRPYWQARPGPVCAASRPILATASVGAGPHRERQRCAEWKKPWHVFSLLLFGWGLLRLGGPGAASCARFSSCGWYPTSDRKNTLVHFLGAQGMPGHRDSSRLRASKSLGWCCVGTLGGAAHVIVVQRCHRGAREGPPGVPTPDTISTRSVHGKRRCLSWCLRGWRAAVGAGVGEFAPKKSLHDPEFSISDRKVSRLVDMGWDFLFLQVDWHWMRSSDTATFPSVSAGPRSFVRVLGKVPPRTRTNPPTANPLPPPRPAPAKSLGI